MPGGDAYIRVRVPGAPRPDGSVLVYLPDGTGLVVHSSLLQASPERPVLGRTRYRNWPHPESPMEDR